jgi:maleate cis-trans isomerase
MKKSAIVVLLIIASCSSKDPKMCECLEAGEKLNQFSSEIMMKEINANDAKKMQTLKANKAKKCADYQEMSGEEMLKRKAECDEN